MGTAEGWEGEGEGRTRIFWQGDKVSSPRREHKIGRDKNLIPDRV